MGGDVPARYALPLLILQIFSAGWQSCTDKFTAPNCAAHRSIDNAESTLKSTWYFYALYESTTFVISCFTASRKLPNTSDVLSLRLDVFTHG